MFRYGPGFHHGVGVFGWLFLAFLAALVVIGVVILVMTLVRPRRIPQGRLSSYLGGPPGPVIDPAISELRMRYARGEISWEDYVQRSSNLGHPLPPGTQPPAPPPGAAPPPPSS